MLNLLENGTPGQVIFDVLVDVYLVGAVRADVNPHTLGLLPSRGESPERVSTKLDLVCGALRAGLDVGHDLVVPFDRADAVDNAVVASDFVVECRFDPIFCPRRTALPREELPRLVVPLEFRREGRWSLPEVVCFAGGMDQAPAFEGR